jgi:MYXO-CTERM domain-containing protein
MKSLDVAVPSCTLLGLLVMVAPSRADACGGTFCDGGSPMPVDQTGEDILFIQDGDQIEVHVRIQYTGEAERFAWMVPLASIPEVSVGSDPLFVAIGRATIPRWTTSRSYENPNDAPSLTTSAFVPGSDTGDEPEVVLEEVVGAFEVVVLAGGTAAEVLEFFTQNDYLFEPEAEPIIQQYLDEGFLITGIKLAGAAGVEAIHPIVFRLTNDEPCVPIRLTAVAAEEDLGIRAYFLGQDRWAPSNYEHVVPNAIGYDWDGASYATYVGMVTRAVDEAGGHAFVTDYAGPTDDVIVSSIWQPSLTADGFELMSAYEAIAALHGRGFISNDPLTGQIRFLLLEYLPPPGDFPSSEEDFWFLYEDYADYYANLPTWDGPAFAADLDELVVLPGMHAVDMLEAWPYLTRLHTTLSPHEMTVDPTFHANADLPDLVHERQADALILDGATWARYDIPLELDEVGETTASARLCVNDESNWPYSALAAVEMPSALRIEMIPQMGPPQVMVDNQEAIVVATAAHNLGTPCNPDGGVDEGGESGTGGGESGGGESGDGESGDGGGTGSGVDDLEGSACACSNRPGDGGPLAWGFGLLGLVGLGLTRRNRRTHAT